MAALEPRLRTETLDGLCYVLPLFICEPPTDWGGRLFFHERVNTVEVVTRADLRGANSCLVHIFHECEPVFDFHCEQPRSTFTIILILDQLNAG